MATIVSCPNCRDQVTLPPEPFSDLVCPHCQAEFSMQPVLRGRPRSGLLREEMAHEARRSFDSPLRAGRPSLDDLEIEPLSRRARHRPTSGVLGLFGHLIGLLAGGALGLAAGYYLLNWFGGPHFNVLDIPLPGIPHTHKAASDSSSHADDKPSASQAALRPTSQPAKAAPAVGNAAPGQGPQLNAPPLPTGPTATPAAAGNTRPVGARADTLPSPSFNADDLSLVLSAAREAVGCPTCKSSGFIVRTVSGRTAPRLPCTVCRGRGSGNITPEVYARLCQLAEVATNVDAGQEAVVLAHREVHDVFFKATDRPEKQASIGRQAAQRMSNLNGQGDGVLLAGTITEKSLQGRYHMARIVLLGQPAPISVISSQAIPFQPGERVAVAGCIVRQPAAELEDYRGENLPVVWGGVPLRLSD
jgi:hypothetical protein